MNFNISICYPTDKGLYHIVRDKQFASDDLQQFIAYNVHLRKADGSFRTFKLQGRLILKNGEILHITFNLGFILTHQHQITHKRLMRKQRITLQHHTYNASHYWGLLIPYK